MRLVLVRLAWCRTELHQASAIPGSRWRRVSERSYLVRSVREKKIVERGVAAMGYWSMRSAGMLNFARLMESAMSITIRSVSWVICFCLVAGIQPAHSQAVTEGGQSQGSQTIEEGVECRSAECRLLTLRLLDLQDQLERQRVQLAALNEIAGDLDARARELEREPDTVFGDWEPVVVGQIHRAESDGILTAYSGGNGDVGRILLMTAESESGLVTRSRGARFDGAAIPVKRGHYYQVRMRSGSRGSVTAYWLPARR